MMGPVIFKILFFTNVLLAREPLCLDPSDVIKNVASGNNASQALSNSRSLSSIPGQNQLTIRTDSESQRRAASMGDSQLPYEITGISPTSSGDLIVTRLRPNQQWGPSWYDQGDPNIFNNLFGRETSNFLGFRVIDNNTRTVPTAEYLAARINQFNSQATTNNRLSLSFYTPTQDRVPDAEYIREYAKNGRLPIARSGKEALHDPNFHSLAAFYPPEVIAHDRRRLAALVDFYDFYKGKLASNPSLQNELQPTFDEAFRSTANYVDLHTGSFGLKVAGIKNSAPSSDRIEALSGVNQYERLTFSSTTPLSDLRARFSNQDPRLLEMLDEFLIQERRRNPTQFRENYETSLNWTEARYRAELRRRLREIPELMRRLPSP